MVDQTYGGIKKHLLPSANWQFLIISLISES